MTVHWETSRKPLFVKTVWTGKHHHAVLNERDPLYATIMSSKRKRQHNKTNKVQRKCRLKDQQDQDEEDEFNISSVRMSLSSSSTNKNKNSSSPRVHTPSPVKECSRKRKDALKRSFTVEVIDSIEGGLQRKPSFVYVPHFYGQRALQLTYQKTFTLMSRDLETELENVSKFSSTQSPPEDTTLSDRVLTWLDLARTQNLHDINIQVKDIESKVDNVLRPKTTEIKLHRDPMNGSFGSSSFSSSNNNDYDNYDDFPPNYYYNCDSFANKNDADFVVTNLLKINAFRNNDDSNANECESTLTMDRHENISTENSHSNRHAKRQLHIFLPDIVVANANKRPDCEDSSVISSNLTSSSLLVKGEQ